MAALSDHDRRDAEHAARAEMAIVVQKYVRRVNEAAKAYIKEALDEAARGEGTIDGTSVGRSAATRAIADWMGIDAAAPQAAIEGSAARAK
jgi:hypothetical protein